MGTDFAVDHQPAVIVNLLKSANHLQPVNIAVTEWHFACALADARIASVGGMCIDNSLGQVARTIVRIVAIDQQIAGIKTGGQAAGIEAIEIILEDGAGVLTCFQGENRSRAVPLLAERR